LWYALFLFPPLRLPSTSGPYNVGVVDCYLKKPNKQTKTYADVMKQEYLSVRIVYPTDATSSSDGSTSIPYQLLGSRICDEYMAFGAPPFLKKCGWLLHHWLLITAPFVRNAPVLDTKNNKKLPTVVYSHGLGGNPALYTSQASNLASHGNVVFMVTHLDGSAPLANDSSGRIVEHEKSIYELRKAENGVLWDTPPYVAGRREQIEIRVEEIINLLQVVGEMNVRTNGGMGGTNVSFVDKLDLDEGVHLVGHSYGGATVLAVAGRVPEKVVRTVTAHDPACDWIPDDVRYNVFKDNSEVDEVRKYGSCYSKKTWGKEESSGLDETPCLFIYCDDWQKTDFGHHMVTLPKLKLNKLGKKNKSYGIVLNDMQHFEFSDNCMILPLWLTKALGFSGKKPEMRGREVFAETLRFIKSN
jgi:platelet-activating factor acetylhydrolase